MQEQEQFAYGVSPPELPPLTPPPEPSIQPEPLTLYGIGLTPIQFRETRAHSTVTRWLMPALALLLGIQALSAVSLAAVYVGEIESSFLLFMVAAAGGLALLGRQRNATAERRETAIAWALYAAGTEGGLTTVFYPDRVEQFSARVRVTLPFSDAQYLESRDLLTLKNGDTSIFLRAGDLTPEEAQMAYERICAAIPPARQYAVGRFAAQRAQSSPPPFHTQPPVTYERFSYEASPAPVFRGLRGGEIPWLLSACFVIATMLTAVVAITESFLFDYLIFLSATFLPGAVLLMLGLWRQDVRAAKARPASRTVTLTFTSAGLLIERDGIERFVATTDVRARRTDNGAVLFTPAGRLVFPWNATQNRQQLEWLLFGQH